MSHRFRISKVILVAALLLPTMNVMAATPWDQAVDNLTQSVVDSIKEGREKGRLTNVKRLLVVQFDGDEDPKDKETKEKITRRVAAAVNQTADFQLVERTDLDALGLERAFIERVFQGKGVDEESRNKLAVKQADAILIGIVTDIVRDEKRASLRLDWKIMDTGSYAIPWSGSTLGEFIAPPPPPRPTPKPTNRQRLENLVTDPKFLLAVGAVIALAVLGLIYWVDLKKRGKIQAVKQDKETETLLRKSDELRTRMKSALSQCIQDVDTARNSAKDNGELSRAIQDLRRTVTQLRQEIDTTPVGLSDSLDRGADSAKEIISRMANFEAGLLDQLQELREACSRLAGEIAAAPANAAKTIDEAVAILRAVRKGIQERNSFLL
jgi:CHASE3 domain sensor protein